MATEHERELLVFMGHVTRLTPDDLARMTPEEREQLDRDIAVAIEWLEAVKAVRDQIEAENGPEAIDELVDLVHDRPDTRLAAIAGEFLQRKRALRATRVHAARVRIRSWSPTRRPRARGAGRPGARAARRGGDSGDSDSGGSGDEPEGAPTWVCPETGRDLVELAAALALANVELTIEIVANMLRTGAEILLATLGYEDGTTREVVMLRLPDDWREQLRRWGS